jgi:hypothetical protein
MSILACLLLLGALSVRADSAGQCGYTKITGNRPKKGEPTLNRDTLDIAVKATLPSQGEYYRLNIPRNAAATLCSASKTGASKTGARAYLPLKFTAGKQRMVEPITLNSACRSADSKGKGGLQMSFKLLDSSQVGVLKCANTNNPECPVYLYNTTGNARYFRLDEPHQGRRTLKGCSCSSGYSNQQCLIGTGSCNMANGFSGSCTSGNCGQYCQIDANCQGYVNCCSDCVCCPAGSPNVATGCGFCVPENCGCFPAEALATTASGAAVRMDALRVGDRVLAARPDGSTFFDEIYMFGHRDGAAAASFVRLETAGGDALRLTADHHLFVLRAGARMEVPAADAIVGDLVHVVRAGAAALSPIAAKSVVPARGLFNPYTLSGSIVVDGVAASVHSSSALDGVFRALGVPLPAGYQFCFAPARWAYAALGARRMAAVQVHVIDAVAAVFNGQASALPPVAVLATAGGAAAALAVARSGRVA